MTILFIITILLFVVYAALLVYYRMAWQQIPVPPPLVEPSTAVTVIIPARNEQDAIGDCLQSITNQNYPAHLLQIIVADDFLLITQLLLYALLPVKMYNCCSSVIL
jgi:cellulose synthase/poly-beta-1,6-N-acetylglucosamine synthase-like glycosyltransferase